MRYRRVIHRFKFGAFVVVATALVGAATNVEAPTFFGQYYEPPPKVPSEPESKAFDTIILTGDVFLGRDVERRLGRTGVPAAFTWLQSFSDTAAVVVNFEAAVPATHVPTPDFGFRFSVAERVLPAVVAGGVTHAGLANNHTSDFGAVNFRHTRAALERSEIEPFGHPTRIDDTSLTVIPTPHGPVAILGIHTLFNPPTANELRTVLTTVSEATPVVAYVHWGVEYATQASPVQRGLASELIDQGVDLVIGHHPHVVQNIDLVNDVPVLYSLGNTVFDQYFSSKVQQGLVVELTFASEGERYLTLHPIESETRRVEPRLLSASQATTWLADLAARSDTKLQADIARGRLAW